IEGDAVLDAEASHCLAPLGAEPGAGGTRLVVETGMENAAVVTRLMRRDAIFRFEDDDAQAIAFGEGPSGRQPDEAGADDGDVEGGTHRVVLWAAARDR